MKYLNNMALLVLTISGLNLFAAEPMPESKQEMAEAGDTGSTSWSLPAKVAGATGLGALGAGAAYATNELLKLRSAEQAVETAKDVLNKIANKELPRSGYRAAMQNLRNASANLDQMKAEAYGILPSSMPSISDIGGYLSNAQNAVADWWNGPKQARNYYPSLDPELGGGAYGLFGVNPIVNPAAPVMGAHEYGFIPAELGGGVYGLAPQAATSWYSPIMYAPNAISSRFSALNPYAKAGLGLAALGALGYGAYRGYNRYRNAEIPATEDMSDEQKESLENLLRDMMQNQGR